MGWTPLFLKMNSKSVLIVGAGEVGKRRAKRFLKEGANVTIIAKNVLKELEDIGALFKPLNEIEECVEWADIIVIATDDHKLNNYVADLAGDKLLNRADHPIDGNLIVPSSFFVGDVQLCIFTQGKSPLMAKELRKKIQNVIKEEDILKLELQNFARNLLKGKIDDQKKRRTYLYEILKDENIEKFLKEGNLEKAKKYVRQKLNI